MSDGINFTPDSAGDGIDFQPDAYAAQPANQNAVPGATQVTQPSAPQVSTAEAAGRGFANTSSFGLGKWVNGMLGATMNVVNPNPTGEVATSIQSSTPKTGEGWWADVTNSVEGQKAANATAMSQHSIAYIAGGAAPAVVGGVGTVAGKLATTGLPTSFLGQTALGAGLGAEGGATESTTGKQLAGNVAAGTVLGGGLSALGSGVSKLITSYGTKGALSAIEDTVADATSSNSIKSDAAYSKLADLTGSKTPTTDAARAALLDKAKMVHGMISNPESYLKAPSSEFGTNINAGMVHNAIKSTAPSLAQVGSEAAETALKAGAGAAAGATAGHFAEGLVPGAGPVVGSILGGGYGGWNPGKQFVGDVTKAAAMRYAGSPGMQALGTASPLAGGTTPSTLGLSGTLGKYIDQFWSNR